jgi:hypothetical protein
VLERTLVLPRRDGVLSDRAEREEPGAPDDRPEPTPTATSGAVAVAPTGSSPQRLQKPASIVPPHPGCRHVSPSIETFSRLGRGPRARPTQSRRD